MQDSDKTKAQLIQELNDLRRQLTELEPPASKAQTIFSQLEKLQVNGEPQHYLRMAETSPDPIFALCQGEIIYANSAGVSLAEASNAEQIIGRPAVDFILFNAEEVVQDKVSQDKEQESEVGLLQKKFIKLNGQTIDVEIFTLPLAPQTEPTIEIAIIRDITPRVQIKDALTRHAQEMSALYEISLEINSRQNLSTLLDAIVRRATALLGTNSGILLLLQPDGETLKVTASVNIPENYIGTEVKIGEGVAGRIIQTGDPLIVENYGQWAGRSEAVHEPVGRILGVPLKQGKHIIGALDVYDEQPGTFNQDEVALLNLFAAQAATAIKNAWLFEGIVQHAEQLDTLRQITQDITLLRDPTALLNTIVEQAMRLLKAGGASIFIFNSNKQLLENVVTVGNKLPPSAHKIKPGQSVLGEAWEKGEPVIVNNYQAYDNRLHDWPDTAPTSAIAVPIKWGNQSLGVLGLGLDDPKHQLTSEDATLLTHFTTQAAIALKNTRLYKQAQQEIAEREQVEAELTQYKSHLEELVAERTRELEQEIIQRQQAEESLIISNREERRQHQIAESLQEVALVLNSSLDQKTVLGKIMEQLQKVIDFDGFGLFLLEDNHLVLRVGSDLAKPYLNNRLALKDGGLTVSTFKNKKLTVIADVHAHPDYNKKWTGDKRIRGWMSIPLMFGTKAIGVLNVDSFQIGAYDKEDEIIAQSFANQAAIAIQNANLFEEARQSRKSAENANNAKSAFLANMSHELRTPLNAVLGFAQLMQRDTTLTAKQQENVSVINRSGQHLLSLINNLLEMSKIETGRIELEKNSFDLYYLLDTLQEKARLKAYRKELELYFQRQPNVPRNIVADENKLRQILSNLLGNAIKFTKQGSVTLTITAEQPSTTNKTFSSTSAEKLIFFEITDTGPGIAPNKMEKLFDPFLQNETRHTSQDGPNLGLVISRQFVELMGGELTVESEHGSGSTFKFYIKARIADKDFTSAQDAEPQVIGLAPNQPAYRLLVVEDKFESRRLLVTLLESVGFNVKEAANGQEAIQIWQAWEPHLIWMDMKLPVMDGYKATKQIKSMPNGKSTIIIALTANVFDDKRQAVFAAGCDDFVGKPYLESDLFEKMAHYLNVEYIYKTTKPKERVGADLPQNFQFTEAVSDLPPVLITDLKNAVLLGEVSKISSTIEQIGTRNPPLAQILATWAQNFEYEKIEALLK